MAAAPGYVGRFAPSPTGPLHFGSLLAALASWLRARSLGGRWLLRIEDIDPPREVPGAARAIIDTLTQFGLVSDRPVLWQSRRKDHYRLQLQRLRALGLVFPCWCSRAQLGALPVHRGPCTAMTGSAPPPAWRLRVADGTVIDFEDGVYGAQREAVDLSVGDFVLWRREDLPSYQLAVVTDDAAQGVTEVVRGADLLDSTPRQILLNRVLGFPTPAYLHVPQALGPDGRKLSKQNLAAALDPGAAMPLIRAALHFLGQPLAALDAATLPELLRQATAAFDPRHIPARLGIAV